jgi:hypothetical protein
MIMKRLLILVVAAIGLGFCFSCEKELKSLAGTYWTDEIEISPKVEIVFTETPATIIETYSGGSKDTWMGTYTYDPPNVDILTHEFTAAEWGVVSDPNHHHLGTISGRIMEIGIAYDDQVMIVKIKRQ